MTEAIIANQRRLSDIAPELARILKRNVALTPARYDVSEIHCETLMVPMRDGTKLATDLYLPPLEKAPAIAMRTPYDRANDASAGLFLFFARRGYAVVSQDCRGTGKSEPDYWDYYLNEPEDSYDLIDWMSKQSWFAGFVGSCGGSYVGQTQWQMATHPAMSTIVPEVSGLGVAINTMHLHMFANAYARSMGKGAGKVNVPYTELEGQMVEETLATGYFNEPLHKPFSEAILARFPDLRKLPPEEAKRWLWEYYCSISCKERVELARLATDSKNITIVEVESLSSIFGHTISHDRHTLPHPNPEELVRTFHAPVLFSTGWYDWGLNDALATWELLMTAAPEPMRSNCRLFVSPSAHNMPGYHEGMAEHLELYHAYRSTTNSEMLLHWYDAVREGRVDAWPRVIYYLMGANEWREAPGWPIPGATETILHLDNDRGLSLSAPQKPSKPDQYKYDPENPTPTVGGSIVSYVYPPGSVDVSAIHKRPDVLTYTTDTLERDLDVVGPLRLVLYASSSALDTDYVGRLSDVFPDGRAIQIQLGALRARYRNIRGEPELLVPGRIYEFDIDMWATANRFEAGHRLRLDLSSADFPHFDRNANRGGKLGEPIPALQTIYHDPEHPSRIIMKTIPS